MLVEIITIGDEILIGQIVDTNSAWMARQLNQIGLKVKQVTSVSDEAGHIIDALDAARQRANIILMTGGLGPTKDDITKLTLAKYFNMGFRRDEETLKQVTSFFDTRKRPMIELNRAQADVPDGCTVIQNKNGTAPCMWFEDRGTIFVSMPGVPFEMMYLMEEEILPRLQSLFELPFIYHKTILTGGIGESFLAQEIEAIEDSLPEYIKLAYLPKLGQVRLRLSATGLDEVALKIEVDEYAKQLIEKVRTFVIAEEDIPMEGAVLQLMEQENLTFSTAESCTGGYIAHLLTQVPGSSKSFEGGAVTYSYDLKQIILGVQADTLATYGAVSEETVKEMALGASKRFKTDYAVAVSGIAGPGGGTADKPVGTVWIAVAHGDQVEAKLFKFGERRIQNIERSAAAALNMLFTQVKLHFAK